MSADIYYDEPRYDYRGDRRVYAIIGTITVTYEVETPEGERYVIGTYDKSSGETECQRFIDNHNDELCKTQEQQDETDDEEDEDGEG
jgi:hypothetical protein